MDLAAFVIQKHVLCMCLVLRKSPHANKTCSCTVLVWHVVHEICNSSLKNSLHYAVLVTFVRMVKPFLQMWRLKVKC